MNKIYYFDDNNNIVSKEESTHFIVQELDENDNLINETHGITKNPWEYENQNISVGEPSPEIKNIMDNVTDKDGNYIFRK